MKPRSQQSTTLKIKPGFQNYICFQVRENLSMYRPTISFHENHQFVQDWNPDTTIKIKILKNEI